MARTVGCTPDCREYDRTTVVGNVSLLNMAESAVLLYRSPSVRLSILSEHRTHTALPFNCHRMYFGYHLVWQIGQTIRSSMALGVQPVRSILSASMPRI